MADNKDNGVQDNKETGDAVIGVDVKRGAEDTSSTAKTETNTKAKKSSSGNGLLWFVVFILFLFFSFFSLFFHERKPCGS